MPEVKVRPAQPSDRPALLAMFARLWPETSSEEHRKELDGVLNTGLTGTLPITVFVSSTTSKSSTSGGELTGFLLVGLRSHADSCDPAHPVGYIEGWFVYPEFRRRGVGAQLVRAAEDWARSQGCREMASDAVLANELSHQAHQRLGYQIVERSVLFRKPL